MAHSLQQLKPSKMAKHKADTKAKANNMAKGTVGSALQKSVSKGMGKNHRVG